MSIHFGSIFRFENVPHKCMAESESCNVKVSMPARDSDRVAEDIYIERCILSEMQWLWKQGIKTLCSCCGHGLAYNAFITVDKACKDRMEALGYESPPDMLDVCANCDWGIMYVPKSVIGEFDEEG